MKTLFGILFTLAISSSYASSLVVLGALDDSTEQTLKTWEAQCCRGFDSGFSYKVLLQSKGFHHLPLSYAPEYLIGISSQMDFKKSTCHGKVSIYESASKKEIYSVTKKKHAGYFARQNYRTDHELCWEAEALAFEALDHAYTILK